MSLSEQDVSIPTPAQRALDYISGRRPPPPNRPPSPSSRSPPIPFLNNNDYTNNSQSYSGLRPRAGTASSRKHTARPTSLATGSMPTRSISTASTPTPKDSSSSSINNMLSGDSREKRRSSTSVKRLSFQEFAKRLSSSSSLLLVQTNTSSNSVRDGSGRVSSESAAEGDSLGIRGGGESKKCGWRRNVGVCGGDGGFL